MSAPPGWYPDPGGLSGMFRFWDGQNWSAALSATPQAAPPPSPAPAPRTAVPPTANSTYGALTGARRTRRSGWMLGLIVVLVALVVVMALVVNRVTNDPGSPTGPGGTPTTAVCPPQRQETPSPQPSDGRVHGGRLSYPLFGAPWSPPVAEYGIPFGRAVLRQSVVIERAGVQEWLAAVLIGQLTAGDGFFSPKDGAAIVVRCVTGTFYGGSEVTRDDRANRAMTVDGHDAWLIESELGFDVPGIRAKHELLIVVIVDTGDGAAGLFYASIPENAPQLVRPARNSLAELEVDS